VKPSRTGRFSTQRIYKSCPSQGYREYIETDWKGVGVLEYWIGAYPFE